MERLSAEAREQDFVLDADVLLQFRRQLAETFIKGAPGTTGALRGLQAIRQRQEFAEIDHVVVVLHAHHPDWMADHGMPAVQDHREKDPLLLLHMLLKALGHLVEEVSEPFWRFWMVAMDALHFASQDDQARKVAPVAIVEALEDGGNDCRGAFGDCVVMRRRCYLTVTN